MGKANNATRWFIIVSFGFDEAAATASEDTIDPHIS